MIVFYSILFVALLLLICVLIKWTIEGEKERQNAIAEKINKLPNRQSCRIIVGLENRYAFALDRKDRKIYSIDETQTKVASFEQIISVEILEDNTVTSSKSTTRTVGGALLGGALAGGAGMVVGGLSGNSQQKKKVSKITVKIKLRDYDTPSLFIPCFDEKDLTDNKCEVELQNAQKIADWISVIIDEVDRQEKQLQPKQSKNEETSTIADELSKLAILKEKGVLTEEEFQSQKTKLLNF